MAPPAEAAPATVGDDDLKKLEYLSLVSKVCDELETHLGCADKALGEFITEMGRNSETVEEFAGKLRENGAEMPDYFVRSLLAIIHAILPPKPRSKTNSSSGSDAKKKETAYPSLSRPEVAPVTAGNDGLKKLEYLSVVSKVCAELEIYLGCADKALAEFIIEICRNSETVEEFAAKLMENGSDMPDYFVRSLLAIIHAILPPKPRSKTNSSSGSDAKKKETAYPSLSRPEVAPVTAGDDGLKKLEYLSVVSKVCAELEIYLGCADKALAEFIIEICRNSETVEEFAAKLMENGSEMPDYFVRSLLAIIHAILPPKPKSKTNSSSGPDTKKKGAA